MSKRLKCKHLILCPYLHHSNTEPDLWYFSEDTSERTTLFYFVVTLLVSCFSFYDLVVTSIKSTVSADVNEHFCCVDLPSSINRNLRSFVNAEQRKRDKWGYTITGGRLGVCFVLMQLKQWWISEPGDGFRLCI